jgi:hypothetical protein
VSDEIDESDERRLARSSTAVEVPEQELATGQTTSTIDAFGLNRDGRRSGSVVIIVVIFVFARAT